MLSFTDEVCRTHGQVANTSYGQLVGKYGKTIVSKLLFHNKNKFVPGNFSMKSAEIENIDAGDLFELGVDFLDQMEAMYNMMKAIFDTFELGNKSISLTASGQCRLSAIAPCVNDTSRLLELTTNVMRYLHLGLPWETLDGHRNRFRSIHSQLRCIYDQMNYLHYLRSLVQIPRLSEDISYFFQTLRKMSDRTMPIEEEHNEFSIQTFDPEQTDELISVTDESMELNQLSYIQQEYSDLSSKYQMVLQALESEQQQRIVDRDAFLEKERNMKSELDALRKSFTELNVTNHESEVTADADSKLEKLKHAYQKLRSDHIALLRQKGDLEKKLVDSTSTQDSMHSKSKTIEESLQAFLNSHDIHVDEITGDEIREAFHKVDEKFSNLQMSLVAKEGMIRDIEQMSDGSNQIIAERNEIISQLEKQAMENNDVNELLKLLWQKQIDDNLSKTVSFLNKEKNFEGGIPSKAEFYSGIHTASFATNISNLKVKSMASQDYIISNVIGTLIKFLPYCKIDAVDLYTLYNVSADLLSHSNDTLDSAALENKIKVFEEAVHSQYEVIRKTNFNPSDNVDNEIENMQAAINEAASRFEQLLLATKADENKKNIDVDIKILDTCSSLLDSVQRLIKEARELQTEITAESGTFAKEFYQKNQKWSQGLISAAKDIGGGAKCLVDAADAAVSGNGKFEEIIAASQEIAGSTAQMVLASRVKAKKDSKKMASLSSTSKIIGEATARVIATCRAVASQLVEKENEIDLMGLSVHQTKRFEMEVQVKVLELENMLEKEREKLFAIRKHSYAKSNDNQVTETVNPDD